MTSSKATKEAFLARVKNGLLFDEQGNERDVNTVTLVFGMASLSDVAEWIAEFKQQR